MSDELLTLPPDVRLMNGLSLLLAGVFGLLVLGLAAQWLLHRPVFGLRAIQIDSELSHNNAVTLRANVASKLAGNFFTLDLAQAKSTFEAVPWVRMAVVRRDFPDRLRVRIEEHEPVALWGPDEDVRLVNTHGEVFEVNQGDVEAESLPRLIGPRAQSPLVLQAYRQLAPLFEAVDSPLAQLELTGRGSWRARLDNGALIDIGPGSIDEIRQRVLRFMATFAQTPSRLGRNIESADLRYPNGYALRLRGVTTAGADRAQKKTR
ncbi:MAG: cell division protein FtsQ/DivIB [Betaproteobacteria bacterium]